MKMIIVPGLHNMIIVLGFHFRTSKVEFYDKHDAMSIWKLFVFCSAFVFLQSVMSNSERHGSRKIPRGTFSM